MNVIKDNAKYYRCTEICLDYLFKVMSFLGRVDC